MKVVLTETFKKQLKKLDAAVSKRVLDYLDFLIILVPAEKHLLQIFQVYGGTVSAITAFYAASVTIS